MRIVLLRHGQTHSNVEGLLDTAEPGPGLTTRGAGQAVAVPDALTGPGPDAIIVSPLLRTSLTARPLALHHGIDTVTMSGIREVEAGDLEMSAEHEAHQTYLTTIFAWARGNLSQRIPGGPDGTTFLARFDEAIADIASAGWQDVVVVSHGAAIRSWASSRVRGIDVDHVERHALHNTGTIEIEGNLRSGWDLLRCSFQPVGGLSGAHGEDPTGEPPSAYHDGFHAERHGIADAGAGTAATRSI